MYKERKLFINYSCLKSKKKLVTESEVQDTVSYIERNNQETEDASDAGSETEAATVTIPASTD